MNQSVERRDANFKGMERGANIIIRDWLRLKPWENLLVVTSENHLAEAKVVKQCALKRTLAADLMVVKDGKGFSSASIEVYVPIEETKTEGILVPDGSLGYIGKVETPFRIEFKEGRMCSIETNKSGDKLKEYMEDFHDEGIYVASEFGIGLNSYAKCRGKCYIEDESSYGTFHIGVGRNLALGGVHEANGHFDLVAFEPDIFVDNRKIMEKGKIIIPEPEIY